MKSSCSDLLALAALTAGLLHTASFAAETVTPAAANDMLSLDLVISNEIREKKLERAILAASDPGSPLYGKYLTLKEIDRQYRPTQSKIDQAVAYLEEAGLMPRVDESGLFVQVEVTVAQAEALSGASLERHTSEDGRSWLKPSGQISLPKKLRGLVDGIAGLDQTPLSPRKPKASRNQQFADQGLATEGPFDDYFQSGRLNTGTQWGCEAGRGPFATIDKYNQTVDDYPYTPNQYLTAYGLDHLHTLGFTGQGERVALLEIDGFDPTDLAGFRECFGLSSRWQPVTVTHPESSHPLALGPETTLDLAVMAAAAPGLAAVDVYESTDGTGKGDGTQKALGETMKQMVYQRKSRRPTVISVSLGGCEIKETKTENLVWERANRRAAALGISVFVSTGDQGPTACSYSVSWGTNAAGVYSAAYPATSPWVTAVGGTNLELDSANQIIQEIPWNDWIYRGFTPLFGTNYPLFDIGASSSGVSVLFKQPRWQRHYPGSRAQSPSSNVARFVPDVSLLADSTPGYSILTGGSWGHVGGTSAAAPLMAGGIAVINSALKAQGKMRVGYFNPRLYRMGGKEAVRARIFTDVTTGNNDTMWQTFGTAYPTPTANAVFNASPGFDGATGWGSPKFPQLLEELK